MWAQIGSGISPDESRNVLINNNKSLSSKRITLGGLISLSQHIQASATIGWAKDETKSGIYSNQILSSFGVSRRF